MSEMYDKMFLITLMARGAFDVRLNFQHLSC